MLRKIFRHISNSRYIYTLLFFGFWMVFIDQNRVANYLKLQRSYNSLLRQKQYYLNEIKNSQEELRRLKFDTAYMEKLAREKYLMKRPGEKVYVVAWEE